MKLARSTGQNDGLCLAAGRASWEDSGWALKEESVWLEHEDPSSAWGSR